MIPGFGYRFAPEAINDKYRKEYVESVLNKRQESEVIEWLERPLSQATWQSKMRTPEIVSEVKNIYEKWKEKNHLKNNIKFDMNLYYDANDLIMKKVNITNDVFCRLGENDCADLYNNLDKIEDEDIANEVCKFISNASVEELKEYINVDENSTRYDGEETYYCDRRTLAYLVSVEFDVEKLVNKLKDKEEDKEMEHPFERSEKEIER